MSWWVGFLYVPAALLIIGAFGVAWDRIEWWLEDRRTNARR